MPEEAVVKVRELMHQKFLTVREDDDLALALQMMSWTNSRELPVVRDGQVVGVISQRDIFAHMAEEKGRESLTDLVGLAMSRPAKVVRADEDDAKAAEVMVKENVDFLPVVEDGSLVGVLSLADLAAERVRGGMGAGVSEGAPVSTVMTRNPKTARPDELLVDVVERMVNLQVRHLPVVGPDGKVVGMLSDRDVRNAVGDPRKALENGAKKQQLQRLKVEEVMSPDGRRVRESEPLGNVLGWFLGARYGALSVVDDQGRLVGIVSYIDLLRGLSGG
ncbi:MAG: CBS domain-containing protein [Myxococcales bacterium]